MAFSPFKLILLFAFFIASTFLTGCKPRWQNTQTKSLVIAKTHQSKNFHFLLRENIQGENYVTQYYCKKKSANVQNNDNRLCADGERIQSRPLSVMRNQLKNLLSVKRIFPSFTADTVDLIKWYLGDPNTGKHFTQSLQKARDVVSELQNASTKIDPKILSAALKDVTTLTKINYEIIDFNSKKEALRIDFANLGIALIHLDRLASEIVELILDEQDFVIDSLHTPTLYKHLKDFFHPYLVKHIPLNQRFHYDTGIQLKTTPNDRYVYLDDGQTFYRMPKSGFVKHRGVTENFDPFRTSHEQFPESTDNIHFSALDFNDNQAFFWVHSETQSDVYSGRLIGSRLERQCHFGGIENNRDRHDLQLSNTSKYIAVTANGDLAVHRLQRGTEACKKNVIQQANIHRARFVPKTNLMLWHHRDRNQNHLQLVDVSDLERKNWGAEFTVVNANLIDAIHAFEVDDKHLIIVKRDASGRPLHIQFFKTASITKKVQEIASYLITGNVYFSRDDPQVILKNGTVVIGFPNRIIILKHVPKQGIQRQEIELDPRFQYYEDLLYLADDKVILSAKREGIAVWKVTI